MLVQYELKRLKVKKKKKKKNKKYTTTVRNTFMKYKYLIMVANITIKSNSILLFSK